jgi:signal peptidase I
VACIGIAASCCVVREIFVMNEEVKNDINAVETESVETEATSEQNTPEKESKPVKTKKQAVVAETISWIKTIVAALVMAWLITTFLIVNAEVPSGSMENTVMTGDRLIANRLSYTFSDPQRFDIVVFKFPDDESKLYIKRIIGMPGDKVTIFNNKIYINDSTEPLRDDFLKEPMQTPNAVYEVPEGCYFMLGDNRNNSADSRAWNNKYVAKDKILGKAVFKYFEGNHPKFEILWNK